MSTRSSNQSVLFFLFILWNFNFRRAHASAASRRLRQLRILMLEALAYFAAAAYVSSTSLSVSPPSTLLPHDATTVSITVNATQPVDRCVWALRDRPEVVGGPLRCANTGTSPCPLSSLRWRPTARHSHTLPRRCISSRRQNDVPRRGIITAREREQRRGD